jgi:hypothetical protein
MNNDTTHICKDIQNNINKLCSTEIDEIFKILHKNKSVYTQNNNGIFVNLNWIDEKILQQIHDYIQFCLRSQTEINKYELMKTKISDSINNKEKIDEDKDEITIGCVNASSSNMARQPTKISSSMKFYLLKKKFQKKYTGNQNVNNYHDNYLTHDEYIKK